MPEPVHEQAAVGKPGQRLVKRLMRELFLDRLLKADIAGTRLNLDDGAQVVVQGAYRHLEPRILAGAVPEPERRPRMTPGTRRRERGLNPLPVVRVAELVGILSDQLLLGVPDEGRAGGAHVGERALQVVHPDEIAGVVRKHPVQVFLTAELLLGLLDRGDVLPHAGQLPLTLLRHPGDRPQEDPIAMLGGDDGLEALAFVRREDPLQLLVYPLALAGGKQVQKLRSQYLVPALAQLALRLGVPFEHAQGGIDEDEGIGRAVDERFEPHGILVTLADRRTPVPQHEQVAPAYRADRRIERHHLATLGPSAERPHPAPPLPERRDHLRVHALGVGLIDELAPGLSEDLARRAVPEQLGPRRIGVEATLSHPRQDEGVPAGFDRRHPLLERALRRLGLRGQTGGLLPTPEEEEHRERQHHEENHFKGVRRQPLQDSRHPSRSSLSPTALATAVLPDLHLASGGNRTRPCRLHFHGQAVSPRRELGQPEPDGPRHTHGRAGFRPTHARESSGPPCQARPFQHVTKKPPPLPGQGYGRLHRLPASIPWPEQDQGVAGADPCRRTHGPERCIERARKLGVRIEQEEIGQPLADDRDRAATRHPTRRASRIGSSVCPSIHGSSGARAASESRAAGRRIDRTPRLAPFLSSR